MRKWSFNAPQGSFQGTQNEPPQVHNKREVLKMNINDIPRKRVATEWDGGWFCDKCDALVHWKTKSYIINNKHLCRKCAEKALDKSK